VKWTQKFKASMPASIQWPTTDNRLAPGRPTLTRLKDAANKRDAATADVDSVRQLQKEKPECFLLMEIPEAEASIDHGKCRTPFMIARYFM
jgi:hypothetical protein